jgi:hypothetical protein
MIFALRWQIGHTVAQAITCWLPTGTARVRSWVRSCGICGDHCGTWVLPPFPPTVPHWSSSVIRIWYIFVWCAFRISSLTPTKVTEGSVVFSVPPCKWRHSTCISHGRLRLNPSQFRICQSKSELYYDRRSVGHSILVPGTYLGPATNFLLFLKFVDSYKFVYVWRPLWREAGSIALNCCWASPHAVFLGSESRWTHFHIL